MTDEELSAWFERKADGTPMPETRKCFMAAADAFKKHTKRSKGCEYCTAGEPMGYGTDSLKRNAYIYIDKNLLTADLYSDSMLVPVCYCPMCGRKLEEDTK